jgi:hypothetical protein
MRTPYVMAAYYPEFTETCPENKYFWLAILSRVSCLWNYWIKNIVEISSFSLLAGRTALT